MVDVESLSEADLAGAREEREGLRWLRDAGHGAFETVQPTGPASTRPVSQPAFDLIVEFEVSGEAVYTAKYRRPTWPGGASGVTIGIGYDLGYATAAEMRADFGAVLPAPMLDALETAVGVTGDPAGPLAHNLGASVDVPWDAAIGVHRDSVLPRWIGVTERALPNTAALSDGSLGALVSLVYNRGASFSKAGDRYAEMRAIEADMQASDFGDVPAQIRAMKRLWPTVRGLQIRRDREAELFEAGLAGA